MSFTEIPLNQLFALSVTAATPVYPDWDVALILKFVIPLKSKETPPKA